jgi:hypothetical protein
MINQRTHYFQDATVITGLCPNGEYGAYREQDDGRVRGYGHTRLAAIADLNEVVGNSDDESDPRADAVAAERDHARDFLKHEVVS